MINLVYLFEPLDEEATIEKVKHFFKYDYKMFLQRCGAPLTTLRSPNMDGMPKAPMLSPDNERLLERASADYERQMVVYTVRNLDFKSCFILTNRFLLPEPKTDTETSLELGYGRTQYSKLKPLAMIKFAEAYQRQDLRVFANRTNSEQKVNKE